MCISVKKSSMSKTYIYSVKLNDGRHFLLYKNKAESYAGKNAMVLAIPSKTDLTKDNFVDVPKDIWEKWINIVCPKPDAMLSFNSRSFTKGISSFKFGSYDILSLSSPESLEDLNELQHGFKVSDEIISVFKEKYPGWKVLVCMWDGSVDAEPIALTYESLFANTLFFPMLDGHDGKLNLNKKVSRDHSLIFSKNIDEKDLFNIDASAIDRINIKNFFGNGDNKDYFIKIEDVATSPEITDIVEKALLDELKHS